MSRRARDRRHRAHLHGQSFMEKGISEEDEAAATPKRAKHAPARKTSSVGRLACLDVGLMGPFQTGQTRTCAMASNVPANPSVERANKRCPMAPPGPVDAEVF